MTSHSLNAGKEAVRVNLPFPPSVNALYRAVGGRSILSAEYRAWKDEAGLVLALQSPGRVAGRVSVNVELRAPDKRRRDADNAGLKAVLDLLVKHQVIEGDDSRFVRRAAVAWVDDGLPCVVTVEAAE